LDIRSNFKIKAITPFLAILQKKNRRINIKKKNKDKHKNDKKKNKKRIKKNYKKK
jgi:hypothetical protein